jgi:tetratricopeptide (TPR) repeat protein
MSYINEALRKVQKDKDSRYASYEHIVSAPAKETKRPRKWLPIAGMSTFIFIAAGIIALMYSSSERKSPIQATSSSPAAAPVVVRSEPYQSAKAKIKLPKATAPVEKKQEFDKSVETKRDIKKSDYLFARAVELQRDGNLQKAQVLYRKAIKLNPDNVQALNNLGVTYIGQKRYKRAIARFNDVLKINPDYTDAHYNLACVYAKKNSPDRSLIHLKDAIDLNPEVRKWAETDSDLQVMSELPSYKKLIMERQ